MEEVRRRIDDIKEKTDRALHLAEDFDAKTLEAKQILHEHMMAMECTRRHKQSLVHQLEVTKKQLKDAEKNMKKVICRDEDHVRTAEKAEARGEVHDMRIIENEAKIEELKKNISENHPLLEDNKRKIHILKRDIKKTKSRLKKQITKIEDMEKLLEKNSSRISEVACQRDTVEDREFELEKMIDHMRDKIRLNEERIQSVEHVIPSLNYQIDVVNQEIKSKKEETQMLKDEMLSGFDEVLFE